MTVEKMAKVVSEINRGLASSRPLGVESASQAHADPTSLCVCVHVVWSLFVCIKTKLNANTAISATAIWRKD